MRLQCLLLPLYLIAFSVLRRIHPGDGLFFFLATPRVRLVLKLFCDGCDKVRRGRIKMKDRNGRNYVVDKLNKLKVKLKTNENQTRQSVCIYIYLYMGMKTSTIGEGEKGMRLVMRSQKNQQMNFIKIDI